MQTPSAEPSLDSTGLDHSGFHHSGPSGQLLLLGALAATALVYAPALAGELVYDDKLLIAQNPLLGDLGNLPKLVTSPYWDFLSTDEAAQIGYWRPLTSVVHALAWALGGGATWAFHLFCVLVHLAATAAAFGLARKLSGSHVVAGVTALVFGLHPVHVESVAWISALNDPLFGLFSLLALWAHLVWREAGSRGIPWIAACCFGLALLSKELGGAVIPLVVVLDLGRRHLPEEGVGMLAGLHHPLRALAPYVLVALLYVAARMAVFHSPGAGFDRDVTVFLFSPSRMALLRVELVGGALQLLAWPFDLKLFRPIRPDLTWGNPAALAALFFLVSGLAVLSWLWVSRRRPALFGFLLIPTALLPALVKISSLGLFLLADRFLYLPVFGLGLGLGLLADSLSARRLALGASLLLGISLGYTSHKRIGDWSDEMTLFRGEAALDSPRPSRSPYVLWGYGRVLLDRYRATRDPALLARASEVYNRAQDLLVEAQLAAREGRESDVFVTSRDVLQSNLGAGWCLVFETERAGQGGYAAPLRLFETLAEEVTRLQQEAEDARAMGLAVRSEHLETEQVYTALGTVELLAGHLQEGEQHLKNALALNPDYADAHKNLGLLYLDRGELRQARHHLERALSHRPRDFETRMALARTSFAEGHLDDALDAAEQLAEENSQSAEPLVILAAVALQRGDPEGALRHVDRALQRDPEHGYAWYHRANAMMLLGRADQALNAYRRSAELNPENFEAQYDLAAGLLGVGALQAAVDPLIAAYSLCPDDQRRVALGRNLAAMQEVTTDQLITIAAIDRGRGELDLAEGWLSAALGRDGAHGPATLAMARLLRSRGRMEEALVFFAKSVAIEPGSFTALSEYGQALASQDRNDEALEFLRKALEIGPPPNLPSEARAASRTALAARIHELETASEKAGPPLGGG